MLVGVAGLDDDGVFSLEDGLDPTGEISVLEWRMKRSDGSSTIPCEDAIFLSTKLRNGGGDWGVLCVGDGGIKGESGGGRGDGGRDGGA